MKCFRDQGSSIYHGSNTIYRSYCTEKGKLTDESQLLLGMAVFKRNSHTPDKFNDDPGDFQHIEMVVHTDPVQIIHDSSVAGRMVKDTGKGKWQYWRKLKNVSYQEAAPDPIVEGQNGYITSDKVNFHSGPGTSYERILQLNKGDSVEILEDNSGWAKCVFDGTTGYVKDVFIAQTKPGETAEPLIHITSSGGKVNIRRGNEMEYSPITSVNPGTSLPYVAAAINSWYAVKTGKQVGWVSPDYAHLLEED